MTEQATTGVQQSVTVPLAPDKAFELFVDDFERWWPNEGTHSLTKEPQAFVLESREGGRWGEQDQEGNYLPWGRVLAVDRPRRILLAWQLTPAFEYDADPAMQTEVEVTFEPDADGATKVTLEHRGFEVWGEPGAEMRGSVQSGWGTLLERYAAHATP
jgi:uncharacterized protein YndB with AHSA1/START domain